MSQRVKHLTDSILHECRSQALEIYNLKNKVKTLQRPITSLEEQISSLTQRNDALNRANNECNKELEVERNKVKEVGRTIDTLNGMNMTQCNTIEQQAKDLDRQAKRIGRLDQKCSRLHAVIVSLTEQRDELKAERDSLKGDWIAALKERDEARAAQSSDTKRFVSVGVLFGDVVYKEVAADHVDALNSEKGHIVFESK